MANISTAFHEYARRPKDERFESPHAMIDAATQDRALSVERSYNLKDLRAVVVQLAAPGDGSAPDPAPGHTVRLESPKGIARFTPWSFAQTCRTLGAPTAYLRDQLNPQLAADCLNYGIATSSPGTAVQLLVRKPNGQPLPIVRSLTSDSYGRVWDSELYGGINQQLLSTDDSWSLPPTWSGEQRAPTVATATAS